MADIFWHSFNGHCDAVSYVRLQVIPGLLHQVLDLLVCQRVPLEEDIFLSLTKRGEQQARVIPYEQTKHIYLIYYL